MLLRRANPAHAEQFGEHANLRQRRSQLMRYAGDEIRTEARQRCLATHLAERDRDEGRGDHEQREQHRESIGVAENETAGHARLE